MRRLALAASLAVAAMASGCGSFSALPAHGGGKRFAIEQALVSAASKKVIGDLPLESLRNRRILLETTIVNDEGGGAVNGGRPYLAEALSHVVPHARGVVGFTALRNDNTYLKDASFNNSDGRQFSNLLASALVRQNVMLNPNPETEGEPEFFVEVIVDVLGTWRSRTDWLVTNTERLQAFVSVEYVISPMKPDGGPRRVGKVGWEAEYRERYVGWVGPADAGIELRPAALTGLMPTLGPGSDSTSNLQRAKPVEFAQPQPPQPIQVNPRGK